MNELMLGPVDVAGVPAAFATSRESQWKETVAEQIALVWSGRPFIEQPCEVDLVFRLPSSKAAAPDVDNLLKPAIDAIGSVLFRPARRGHQVRWNADDHWIYRFTAEKIAEDDSDKLGMQVTVRRYRPVR